MARWVLRCNLYFAHIWGNQASQCLARWLQDISSRRLSTFTHKSKVFHDYKCWKQTRLYDISFDCLQMFGADEASQGAALEPQQAVARRKQLVFQLNRSGQYLHIKEQLKACVLHIVKEHYHKSGSMAREEMQARCLSRFDTQNIFL